MTIDIRARVTCNLGDVISASISDDYIQGSGLIKTKGSCQINGIVTPRTGDLVTFQYVKSGITRRIPRALRVLSSFADPFRKVTTIELGCKFTYLANLKDPLSWDAFNDPLNGDRDREEVNVVIVPIYARSLAQQCLDALGISGSVPLTNRFSIAEFDFSGGYVDVLSDLLVSESYCGYLDQNEQFQLIDLASAASSGPIVRTPDLIDVGPINFGDIPGDAVFVRYNTLKLKTPDGQEIPVTPNGIFTPQEDSRDNERPFGDDIAESVTKSSVLLTWQDPNGVKRSSVFPVLDASKQTTSYRLTAVRNDDGSIERKNLVTRRVVTETKSAYAVAGNVAVAYFSAGSSLGNVTVLTVTVETFSYDSRGNETRRDLIKTGNSLYEEGALGIPLSYDDGLVSVGNRNIDIERSITTSRTADRFTASTTQRFVTWPKTAYGQQAIAAASEFLDSRAEAQNLVDGLVGSGLFLLDTTSEVSSTGSRSQSGPLPADRVGENNVNTDDPDADPDSGYRTRGVSLTQIVTGDASSQNRIEFQLPYAPDDQFIRLIESLSPLRYTYKASSSDAPQKAKKFGDVQNRMLLGNRNGMNIQIEPEKLPSEPFAPLFVEAAGVIALYRVNAASWTIDASGIIASTDAMFWGTAGTT